jgi:hypothetical protein
MSEVTNVILLCSYGEDYLELVERDGGPDRSRRRYKGVEAINLWLNSQGRGLLGSFNYLDLEGLAEQIKAFAWDEPENVQLFVKEEEDDTFWEYDLGLEGDRKTDVDS